MLTAERPGEGRVVRKRRVRRLPRDRTDMVKVSRLARKAIAWRDIVSTFEMTICPTYIS
jgi:hypothetical protein